MARSALESALACPNVLAMIFDHLAPGRPDGRKQTDRLRHSCRKALALSAVTCSTLSHHALNVLWRELDNTYPLLETLPNHEFLGGVFVLRGAISDEHWTRFQLYANRVRTIISPESGYLAQPHPSVWLFLSAKCRGSPLMPCLRALSLNSLGSSETSALLLLLSPSLRNLNMQFSIRYEPDGENEIAERVVLSLFQTLPLMAPNLESLEYDLDIQLGHGYIESFRHFTRLKNLSIVSRTPVDEHALGMLSSIPNLRDLSCSIDLSSSSVSRPPHYTFQRLTSLLVRGCFDNLTTFMLACQLPALASIALHIQQPPSTGELVDSFAAICRRCDPALLTSFSVNFAYSIAPLDPSQGILQYLEPLLAFPNIKSFDVEFSCRPMPRVRSMHRLIHDDDFPRFGTAWPRLSSFRVWSSRSEEVARATLSGLIDLARRCPHLDLFHVSELDMGVFPLEKDTALPLNHCLRSFSICRPWLPSPKSLVYLEAATLVGRVFPSIDLDDSQSWILQSNDAEMWKHFLGLSEAMRLGGKEGGLRADLGQG